MISEMDQRTNRQRSMTHRGRAHLKQAWKTFVLIALVFCIPPHLSAQWVRTCGPYGTRISAEVLSGSNLFAGTVDAGVFRSTDRGYSWIRTSNGLGDSVIICLAAVDSVVFAGTNAHGVFRTTNAGDTWTQVMDVDSIVGFYVMGSDLYLAQGTTLFRSRDHGETWISIPFQPPSDFMVISGIGGAGSDLMVAVSYRIFHSMDSSKTWQRYWAGLPDGIGGGFGPLTSFQGVIYTAANYTSMGGNLISSTNQGTTWYYDGGIDWGWSVRTFAVSRSYLYVGTYFGLYRTDSAVLRSNWSSINGNLENTDVSSLALSDSEIFAGSARGVYRSTSSGAVWEDRSFGMSSTQIQCFATHGSNIYAASHRFGVLRSTDDGATWSRANAGLKNLKVRCLVSVESTLVALTDQGASFYSTDGGALWTPSQTSPTTLEVHALTVLGSDLYAGADSGYVFYSNDNGVTWARASSRPTTLPIRTMESLGTELFVGTDGAGVFRTSNAGLSWTPMNVGLANTYVKTLVRSSDRIFAGTSSGVFISSDAGLHWSGIATGPQAGDVTAMLWSDNTLYYGSTNGRVYCTTDMGKDWRTVGDGLTDDTVDALAYSHGAILAILSNGGMFVRPSEEMTTSVTLADASVPPHFSLSQNYPNPFNPTTRISVTIGRVVAPSAVEGPSSTTAISGQWTADSWVRLVVYDLLGREVAILANGRYPAGTYSFTFDGSRFASGVYVYRLTVGQNTAVRTMTLMK